MFQYNYIFRPGSACSKLFKSLILNLNQLNFRKLPLLFRDRVLISYSHIQFQKNQQIFSLDVGLEEDKTSHSFLLRVVFFALDFVYTSFWCDLA